MTYAQAGEDEILFRFFGGQAQGYFVDVGAYDGTTYSNTYLFEKMGWRGICVEPNPAVFDSLKISRPNSVCLNVACIGEPLCHSVTLYRSQMPILSTLNPGSREQIAIIHGNVGLTFTEFEELTVPARTLNDILYEQEPGAIDMVSIDTEWTNADTLAGFSLLYWRPRVVVIEVDADVERGMAGYHLARRHSSNLFYVRDLADMARMAQV